MPKINTITRGDALEVLKSLPDESVHCVVTSPPYYGLRDYGVSGQIGLEETPEKYVEKMTIIFREIRRVLKKEVTCWLNIGDSYSVGGCGRGGSEKQRSNRGSCHNFSRKLSNGLKQKEILGIPWRVAFACQADGWYLRQDIVWAKPNPMTESMKDRCTKSHEFIFFLVKSRKYYFDAEAIKTDSKQPDDNRAERGSRKRNPTDKINGIRKSHRIYPKANKRDVWIVPVKSYPGAHFAVYPEELITPCILAGSPEGGIVLDPFMGSGTTAVVAKKFNREFIGVELNPEYIRQAEKRIAAIGGLF